MSDLKIVGSYDVATGKVFQGVTLSLPLYRLASLPAARPSGAMIFVADANGNAGALASVYGKPVTAVVVTNGGSGYTSAPVVSFAGDGVGAAGTATVVAGVVTAVAVTLPGSGYSQPPLVSFGGPGKDAAATATVAASTWLDVNTGVTVV